jgi:hypothetical protein
MQYGRCVSCGYDLKDGQKRTIASLSQNAYCCNDSTCIAQAENDGYKLLAISGKTTINKPGEQGIFRIK